MPVEAPKEDFVKKEISIEEAQNSAITRDVINSILPPRQYEKDGKWVIQYVSIHPATRGDVVKTQAQLDKELQINHALETGLCPIRSELYAQCFDEIIRQVAIDCSPRGLLLLKLRDELNMTINCYRSLYESALEWGVRKTSIEGDFKSKTKEENKSLKKEIEELKIKNNEMMEKIETMKKNYEEEIKEKKKHHQKEIEGLNNEINKLWEELRNMLVSK
ncbi:28 kDa inner dynein arm light chain, axonemal [Tritrichomonas foetus]|uniref:28 kDa inner dynein arm light chain, axonemal n=1 Tax=Tritrichomonas foetus TaxID=1144522 RepID=A0A1J4KNQ7_9EUKA|nr:28 kDa inner dynein arm light chain, axonemal [Tritrichomonas foetus]|eukprot:OHT12552.1 28 kDa inner dynein arm light chain, axonemal [Tritrichomonas foetus]